MGFIIRCAFWLSLVLLIIPIGGAGGSNENAVSPIQALFAAREAVGDIAGICERKPDVCNVGRAAMHTIGVRAKESARIAMDYLEDDKASAEVTGSIQPVENVSASVPTPTPAPAAATN